MNLVIVESPAKAKTINKYLGDKYKVLASYGHIRDLPSKNGSVDPDQDFLYIASLCAFLGHVFPIWLKFKGGKGVATYVGILFSINIYFGIIFTISWFVTFFITKYSSLSSLIGEASIPIYLLILTQFDQVFFFIIMFVLIFFTHRENIKRLKNKEETKTKIY